MTEQGMWVDGGGGKVYDPVNIHIALIGNGKKGELASLTLCS